MSIDRLDMWVKTVVGCLLEKEEHGGHRQNEHADENGTVMQDTRIQINGHAGELLTIWL